MTEGKSKASTCFRPYEVRHFDFESGESCETKGSKGGGSDLGRLEHQEQREDLQALRSHPPCVHGTAYEVNQLKVGGITGTPTRITLSISSAFV